MDIKLNQENLLHQIISCIPDVVAIINEQGKVIATNEQTSIQLGYQKSEIIGKQIAELPFFPDISCLNA